MELIFSKNLSAEIEKNAGPDEQGQFPADYFTLEQRQSGAGKLLITAGKNLNLKKNRTFD